MIAALARLVSHAGSPPMLSDFRYAVRSLRRQPTFTAAVVLTLALGIGATIAVYTLVDAALLRRLPFRDPGRVVFLWGVAGPDRNIRGASIPETQDWRDRNRTLTDVSVYDVTSLNLRTEDGAERISAEMVSPSFFKTLGVTAQRGRTFQPDEGRVPDRDAVVVISDAMWHDRFGGASDVVGRRVTLNDRLFTIVGVMPKGFKGLSFAADVWFPDMMVPITGVSADVMANRVNRWLAAVGRLRHGVTREAAQRDLDRVARELESEYRDTNRERGVQLMTLRENYLGSTARLLWTLLAAVGLLLLIACANVASLQLVRATARTREVALRLALGAGRRRLVRQLLAESVLLSFVGGAGGVLIAMWGTYAILPLLPNGVLPAYVQPSVDLRVLAVAVVLCAACGILVGLMPALRSARRDPALSLKSGGRSSSGGIGGRTRAGAQQSFVVAEIALSLVLLVGAGLVTRSLSRQLDVDVGFVSRHVLTARLSLPAQRYGATERVLFVERLQHAIASMPTVTSATVASEVPMSGQTNASSLTVDGVTDSPVRYFLHKVTPAYFATLGIALRRGRDFDARDQATSPRVVIVSEATARRFWPNRDPVGARVRLGAGPNAPEAEVVGVVATARFQNLTSDLSAANSSPDVYFPYAQRTDLDLEIAVKTTADPAALTSSLREAVRGVDPTVPLFRVVPLDDLVLAQTASSRFTSIAMAVFSAVALLLAAVGIYGVMAYLISIGRREIAIRMALGATAANVVRGTIGQSLRLAASGLVIGLVAAGFAARLITGLLFGISPLDGLTLASTSALVLVTTLVASAIPSRRASRIEPQEALRAD